MTPAALVLLAAAAAGPTIDPSSLGFAQRVLVAREAQRLKLDRAPAVAARLAKARTDAAVEQLVRDATVDPTDAELRAAYDAATGAALVEGVILETREAALAAKARLEAGAPIAEEAKASVEPVARNRKGDLGWMPRRAMPAAMAEAVFAGATAKPLGPFQVEAGWAVVRVVERRGGDDAGFEATRAALLAEARGQAAKRARAAILARQRERLKPRLDEPFVLAAAAREPTEADRSKVIATVGKQPITWAAVLDFVKASHGGAAKVPPPMAKGIAERLVDAALLEAEAARAGSGRRPAAVKAFESAREEILVSAYYQDVAAKVAEPSEAELEAWFGQHRAEFRTGDADPSFADVRDRVGPAWRFERITAELRTRIAALEASAARAPR